MIEKEATKNALKNSNTEIEVNELNSIIRYDISEYESPDMRLKIYFSFDKPLFTSDVLHAINALMTKAIRLLAYNGLIESKSLMIKPITISIQ